MGTAAWICFDCRSAVRRDATYLGVVACPLCRKPCVYIGYKIPVPPKRKAREWAALRQHLIAVRTTRELAADARAVRCRHDTEQEIAR